MTVVSPTGVDFPLLEPQNSIPGLQYYFLGMDISFASCPFPVYTHWLACVYMYTCMFIVHAREEVSPRYVS